MKRGFMLLEVVVAVGILAVGMAFIGMQIQYASRHARESERTMRTLLLAESKLTELDAGLIVPEEKLEATFGAVFPDYGWRLEMKPTATPELNHLTLEILYQARQDVNEEFRFDEAEVVQRLYTLRATPRPLNLVNDFGMPEEQADKLTEQLAGVGDGGLDPRNLNPALFAQMDLEQLLEVAPPLLEAFGINMEELMQMLPEDLRQMVEDALAESRTSTTTGPAEGGVGAGAGSGSGKSPGGGAGPGGGQGSVRRPGEGTGRPPGTVTGQNRRPPRGQGRGPNPGASSASDK